MDDDFKAGRDTRFQLPKREQPIDKTTVFWQAFMACICALVLFEVVKRLGL